MADFDAGLAKSLRRIDNDTYRLAVDLEDATGITVTVGGIAGDVAHDSADSGNPIKIGGKGSAAAPTAVTEGDRVNASFTLAGSARVLDDNSAAAAASLSVLDDWDETNRAAVNTIAGQAGVAGGSGANSALTQRVTVATDDSVATDLTSIRKSTSGAGAPTIDSYGSAAVSAAANTADQSLVAAPGANKQIWVYAFAATSTLAGSMSLQDEDNTAITGVMPFGATGGIVMPNSGNFAMPLFKVATNKALEIDTVTGDAKGLITYAIVSV